MAQVVLVHGVHGRRRCGRRRAGLGLALLLANGLQFLHLLLQLLPHLSVGAFVRLQPPLNLYRSVSEYTTKKEEGKSKEKQARSHNLIFFPTLQQPPVQNGLAHHAGAFLPLLLSRFS